MIKPQGKILCLCCTGLFFLICFLTVMTVRDAQATFYGEAKTGLQQIENDKYGYTLYVPEDYSKDKGWPMVVALHDEGQKGDEYIRFWAGEAKKRGFILISPTYPIPRETPFDSDRRILRIKREVQNQYEIDSNRILVTGTGFGGHYAFHLGIRYPKQFSYAASIGNASIGPLDQYFRPSYAMSNRLPLLMLVEPNDQKIDASHNKAITVLQKEGYNLQVEKLAGVGIGTHLDAVNFILDWFDQISQPAKPGGAKRSDGVSEKFKSWIDRVLQGR